MKQILVNLRKVDLVSTILVKLTKGGGSWFNSMALQNTEFRAK